mgnify:CR=1 FL=1
MGGVVTLRDFKQYLLLEGVRSQTDMQVLYEHFEIILKTYKRTVKKSKEGQGNASQVNENETTTTARMIYQNLKRIIDSDE